MIKAVVFDFFGVISSDEYWHFIGVDKQKPSVFREISDQTNLGNIDWQAFLHKVAEVKKISVDEIQAVYESEQLNPQILSLIETLHAKYKTGLLTNAHHDYIDQIIEKAHLRDLFDVLVISSREGVIKPDPRIFQIMLERLEASPEEIIYVDDQQRHVEAAKLLGIKAILYQDYQQLAQELSKLL